MLERSCVSGVFVRFRKIRDLCSLESGYRCRADVGHSFVELTAVDIDVDIRGISCLLMRTYNSTPPKP